VLYPRKLPQLSPTGANDVQSHAVFPRPGRPSTVIGRVSMHRMHFGDGLTRNHIQRELRQSDGLSGVVSLARALEMTARACPPCYPKANPAGVYAAGLGGCEP
jgi:hypothetical protein